MKKVFVKKEDYDNYKIRLPLRFFTKRKRKNFISRELEKNHPCYSMDTCTDEKLKIEHFGITADVVVMEREKISQYKINFPKKNLFLEENKKRSVFNSDLERKRKILLLSILAIISFATIKVCNFLLDRTDEKIENTQITKNEERENLVKESLFTPQELFSIVLASIRSKKGYLKNLSWSNGKCSFAIEGCNSEDISCASYCVVSYSSGQPQFNFVSRVNDKKIESNRILFDSDFKNVENLIPLIRNSVIDCECEVLSEKSEKDFAAISFVSTQKQLKNVLQSVFETARLSGWIETAISLENANFNENENPNELSKKHISINLSFKNLGEKIEDFDSPLKVLSNYCDVFVRHIEKKTKNEIYKTKMQTQKNTQKVAEKSNENVKIGEIKKNGKLFSFYRNSNGNIFKEVNYE